MAWSGLFSGPHLSFIADSGTSRLQLRAGPGQERGEKLTGSERKGKGWGGVREECWRSWWGCSSCGWVSEVGPAPSSPYMLPELSLVGYLPELISL